MFRNNQETNNLKTGMTENMSAPPPQELFVNNLPPEVKPHDESSFRRLKKFLNSDHFSDGLTQGYLIHSEAGIHLYISDLKSRFRMEANALDELIRDLILSKQKKLIDLGDLLPNIKGKLQLEIISDQEMREELKYQKMMSVEGEGWIAQVLYAFEKGYRKGMIDFLSINEFSTRGIL